MAPCFIADDASYGFAGNAELASYGRARQPFPRAIPNEWDKVFRQFRAWIPASDGWANWMRIDDMFPTLPVSGS
jgi:hypothetical protein